MPLKKLLLLLSVCSLVSCKGNGPSVTICIIDSVKNELQCSTAEGVTKVLALPDAQNFVCLSPEDFNLVLNYVKNRCKK